jgi:uncharacterized protein YkwD
MIEGNRWSVMILAALLLVPAFVCTGCQNPFRVSVNASDQGAQVSVDSPDFRMRAQGGPYGGRVDFDSPSASVHVNANATPRYSPSYPPNSYPGRYPLSPDSSATQPAGELPVPVNSGPSAPADSSAPPQDPGPYDYSSPLPDVSGSAAELAALSTKDQAAAPAAVQRFAQQQQAPADLALRSKVDPVGLEEASNELAMLEQLNQTRQKHELGTVSGDPTLDKIARQHSEEMEALNYFDHTSPVDKNKTLGLRYKNQGVGFRKASENIAKFPYKLGGNVTLKDTGRLTAQTPKQLATDMMEGYMNSPGHRANILDPQVGKVGLATVIGKRFALNTQNFKD